MSMDENFQWVISRCPIKSNIFLFVFLIDSTTAPCSVLGNDFMQIKISWLCQDKVISIFLFFIFQYQWIKMSS